MKPREAGGRIGIRALTDRLTSSRATRVAVPFILYLILFVLYTNRTIDTLRFPYLYAEDGNVLTEGAIYQGISMIFSTANGTYWVLPKLVACISYRIALLIGDFGAMPYIMSVAAKLIAVLGVAYLLSDRFAPVMPSQLWRFITCAAIILFIPYDAFDVVECDTSLPFTLLITVFFIGLKCFCAGEVSLPTWGESLFLALMALSSAAAPFMAAIVWLAAAGRVYEEYIQGNVKKDGRAAVVTNEMLSDGKPTAKAVRLTGGQMDVCEIISVAAKLVLVTAATLIQLFAIGGSTRVDGELALGERLVGSLQNLVFFPWWHSLNSWKYFLIGLALWLAAAVIARVPLRIAVYGLLSSYAFLLYCSFTGSPEFFFDVAITSASRYIFLSVEIAAFFLCLFLQRVFERGTVYRLVCAVLILAGLRYARTIFHVQMVGADRTDALAIAAPYFAEDGEETAFVPIPPQDGWYMRLPVSLEAGGDETDLIVTIETGEENIYSGSAYTLAGETLDALFMGYDGEWYAVSHLYSSSRASGLFSPSDTNDGGFVIMLPSEKPINLLEAEWLGLTRDGSCHRLVN